MKLTAVTAEFGKPTTGASGCLTSAGEDTILSLDGGKTPNAGETTSVVVGGALSGEHPLLNVFIGTKLNPPGIMGGARAFITAKELRVYGGKTVAFDELALPVAFSAKLSVSMPTDAADAASVKVELRDGAGRTSPACRTSPPDQPRAGHPFSTQ